MRLKTTLFVALCALLFCSAALAQQNYSSSDLDTLVGPIALYPDPVLSNVIKASTFPDQVVAASTASSINDSWDDSVKALDSYPAVLSMMAGNLTWTKSLGWAASNQLADLMDAVQRYRYRAQQAGNLNSNDKVEVIQEGTTIRIEPANPQVIYVPTYPPDDVDQDDFGGAFIYGAAVATSAYLWTNMYHWNDNCFYAHPYGWRPPAGYYRPYGWQSAGVYNGSTVRLNGGNNVYRGPVTVNNVNVNGNRTNISGNTVNSARWNNNNTWNSSNWNSNNWNNRVQGESRASVAAPAMPTSMPSAENRWSNPGWGSYSSAGSTMRESDRGAYSRGTTSFSSGARMGGGWGGGGRRR